MAGHVDREALRELAQQQINGTTTEEDDVEAVSPEAWKLVQGREDQVFLVAQSLAFVGVGAGARAAVVEEATTGRAKAIHAMVSAAYADEEVGREEGFRRGPLVDLATIDRMLRDPECRWLCCEAASGRGVDSDGALLGVACVSIARRNSAATMRFLAIDPKFRGLCVGRRLLDRVERDAKAAHLRTLCVCIPSPRTSMRAWAERRGFAKVDQVDFPKEDLQFSVVDDDAKGPKLIIYAKTLLSGATRRPPLESSYDAMD